MFFWAWRRVGVLAVKLLMMAKLKHKQQTKSQFLFFVLKEKEIRKQKKTNSAKKVGRILLVF